MRFGGSVLVLITVSLFPAASAQTFFGSIRGRVVDAGGVVTDATVDLVERGTGVKRSTTSNGSGEYLFAGVAAGAKSSKPS